MLDCSWHDHSQLRWWSAGLWVHFYKGPWLQCIYPWWCGLYNSRDTDQENSFNPSIPVIKCWVLSLTHFKRVSTRHFTEHFLYSVTLRAMLYKCKHLQNDFSKTIMTQKGWVSKGGYNKSLLNPNYVVTEYPHLVTECCPLHFIHVAIFFSGWYRFSLHNDFVPSHISFVHIH